MLYNIFKHSSIVATVIVALVTSVMVGCQQEDNSLIPFLSGEKASTVAREYLVLSGNQYVLNLSEKSALALGISSSDYIRIGTEISQTNLQIENLMQDPNNHVILYDPQNMEIRNNLPRLKTQGTESSGIIGSGNIPDQNPVTIQIFVSSGYSHVHFNMYSQSVIGAGNVTVHNAGSDWFFQFTVFGGNCDIALPYSNTSYTVTLSVSSTFGGSYSYYYYYK